MPRLIGKAIRTKRWSTRKQKTINAYKSEPFMLGHLLDRYGPIAKTDIESLPDPIRNPLLKLQEKRKEIKQKVNSQLDKMGIPKDRLTKLMPY